VVQLDSRIDGATTRNLAELKKAREPWAVIFTDVEFVVANARKFCFSCDTLWLSSFQKFATRVLGLAFVVVFAPPIVLFEQVWSDFLEKLNIVVGMKQGHLLV